MPARTEAPRPLESQVDDLLTCVHCGFCLPACPTYELLGDENDSPRGRLYLMRAVAEGRLEASDPSFALHLDRCLGCRACEPACPSGVRYGFLLERAREARAAAGGAGGRAARAGLRLLFASRWIQLSLWGALRLLRATGVPRLISAIGGRRRSPGRFRFAMAMLAATSPARLPGPSARSRWRRKLLTRRRRGRATPPDADVAALLEGCVMFGLLRHVNRATERVVRAHGAEPVSTPAGLCCGALHAHAGELDAARGLARRMIDAFEERRASVLISNSAGCAAALKDYGEWLREDPAYAARAERLSSAARDLSEWLTEGPRPAFGSLAARVAHDAPCHQVHAQLIRDAPLELLKQVEGLEVVSLPRSDRCCGAAGIYGLAQRALSGSLLKLKLEEIRETGVEWITTGNPGCLMQIGAGAIVHGLRVKVLHPVEILDVAMSEATSS